MKPDIDIDLERYVYFPAETVNGKVSVCFEKPEKIENLELIFYAQEVIGSDSIIASSVNVTLNEELFLYPDSSEEKPLIKTGIYPFSFQIPDDARPSFSSVNFSCSYQIKCKCILERNKKTELKKVISVVNNNFILPRQKEVEFGFEENEIKARFYLEKDSYLIGQTIKGSYFIEYSGIKKPKNIHLRIRSFAERLDLKKAHSQDIWYKDIQISDPAGKDCCIRDVFGIELPSIAPFSGFWNTFRVEWVIEAEVVLYNGERKKCRAYFDVYKVYDKLFEFSEPVAL